MERESVKPLKVNMRDITCTLATCTLETINSCWKHVGLFSDSEEPTVTEKGEQDEAVMTALENAIARLPGSDASTSQ